MTYKTLTAIAAATLLASAANAEWHYGVGTAVGATSYDGDAKFDDAKLDVDYDSSDIEKAFGGSAFATNGTWVFSLSGSSVEYESKDTVKNTPAPIGRTKNTFEQSGAEFTVGYVVYKENDLTITPFAGVRYTKQEWTIKNNIFNNDDDADWTDGVFGVKVDYKINDEWTWNNSASYAAGDSEGCSAFQTGVSWKFAEHWVTGAFVKYAHDEFEEDDFGGSKYKYDTDVTTLGLSIAYVW
ncbi:MULTISPECIES: outer membrane beta-barrel protein [unclassified Lentimonas]|uniref:outer membrane beta-barrel protein n=1 Tax=unclassified Lentimonas TaxID=2630993 RepID=UPI001323C2FA|nr:MULTISPECIES: outer membrane beta-barrel protein [unclassified Lentimonas]CAA6677334.1 Unannotated [Lentimonas sp. CC4]CAA6686879.1 Unannotated [Lentimonas sp. CC6]CAA7074580.1 Unannotated [Lentimonas sp. CC4]CAA7169196.1 Unannotated [Lentimonas sp. CC21]CAA7180403.1 Unannotated [Lentimonas sp. CC8]